MSIGPGRPSRHFILNRARLYRKVERESWGKPEPSPAFATVTACGMGALLGLSLLGLEVSR